MLERTNPDTESNIVGLETPELALEMLDIISIDFATWSIGDVTMRFLSAIYSAAPGDSRMTRVPLEQVESPF